MVADVTGTLDESVGNLNIVGIALSSDEWSRAAFAALAGHHRPGEFIDEACRRGAVTVSPMRGHCHRSQRPSDIPIVVYEQRDLIAHIAAFSLGSYAVMTMVG